MAVLALVVGACGGDDDSGSGSDKAATDTTAAPAEPLKILVTNDGVEGEGIDALVEALSALPDTEITVVAPLEDQSGTGDTISTRPP